MNEHRFRELDQEMGRILDRKAGIVMDLLGEEHLPENYEAWIASGDKKMNDTRCEECGSPVEDDYTLCYVCSMRNEQAEHEANEIRSAGRTEDE